MPPPHGFTRGNCALSKINTRAFELARFNPATLPAGPPPTIMTSYFIFLVYCAINVAELHSCPPQSIWLQAVGPQDWSPERGMSATESVFFQERPGLRVP